MADPSAFTQMAEAIERNKDATFGGAFVVMPPGPEAVSVETLILDSKQDEAQFWNMLMTKCQMMLAEIDQRQRTAAVFGKR